MIIVHLHLVFGEERCVDAPNLQCSVKMLLKEIEPL